MTFLDPRWTDKSKFQIASNPNLPIETAIDDKGYHLKVYRGTIEAS